MYGYSRVLNEELHRVFVQRFLGWLESDCDAECVTREKVNFLREGRFEFRGCRTSAAEKLDDVIN